LGQSYVLILPFFIPAVQKQNHAYPQILEKLNGEW
jgi:hypothetical protein